MSKKIEKSTKKDELNIDIYSTEVWSEVSDLDELIKLASEEIPK